MRFILIILFIQSTLFSYTPSFSTYDALLKKSVCNGLVDYQVIRSHDLLTKAKSDFEITRTEYESLKKSEQLAYLINAYNYYTLVLITQHYPIQSIRKTSDPWGEEYIQLIKGENKVSLDDIEHKLIRKKFDEPRIHFALVCASISCPSLSNNAYNGVTLDAQLQNQAATFLKDPSKNRIKKDQAFLSRIFKWYGDDFDSRYKNFESFISTITNTRIDDIEWLDYDWNLNDTRCAQ